MTAAAAVLIGLIAFPLTQGLMLASILTIAFLIAVGWLELQEPAGSTEG